MVWIVLEDNDEIVCQPNRFAAIECHFRPKRAYLDWTQNNTTETGPMNDRNLRIQFELNDKMTAMYELR